MDRFIRATLLLSSGWWRVWVSLIRTISERHYLDSEGQNKHTIVIWSDLNFPWGNIKPIQQGFMNADDREKKSDIMCKWWSYPILLIYRISLRLSFQVEHLSFREGLKQAFLTSSGSETENSHVSKAKLKAALQKLEGRRVVAWFCHFAVSGLAWLLFPSQLLLARPTYTTNLRMKL